MSLARTLARRRKQGKSNILGRATNNAPTSANNPRQGRRYGIAYDTRKKQFFHDYGDQKVYIKKRNDLTATYLNKYGPSVKKLQSAANQLDRGGLSTAYSKAMMRGQRTTQLRKGRKGKKLSIGPTSWKRIV